jgi:putative transposase
VAGIVENIEDYKWSSYHEFLNEAEIIDTDFILRIFGKEEAKAIENFKSFHKTLSSDGCLDIKESKKITDREAIDIIKRVCNVSHCIDLQTFEADQKNKCLRVLKKKGFSTRQITRLTGISRALVLKA